MSPRAAWRLEQLGFTDVYDYRGGKQDWIAAGLGREGHAAATANAGETATVEVATCRRADTLGVARKQASDGVCVVTTDEGIVVGQLRLRRLADHDDDEQVDDVMETLPHTERASVELPPAVEQLRAARLEHVIITTPEGRLIGVLFTDDAEEVLAQQSEEND